MYFNLNSLCAMQWNTKIDYVCFQLVSARHQLLEAAWETELLSTVRDAWIIILHS